MFRLPGGNEDSDLWACVTNDSLLPSSPVICSVWELSGEERRAIADGAAIELIVWGDRQPPVMLQTTTEPLGARERVPE